MYYAPMTTPTAQLQEAVNNAGDYFQNIYLDWLNNYLSIPQAQLVEGTTRKGVRTAFAIDNGLTEKQARQQIEIGRKIHNQRTGK